MKKIFIALTIIFLGLAVHAKANYLHSITLEKNGEGYNVVLNSDAIAKVERHVPESNKLVLELSGIKSSDTINAMYKGTNGIDNLVVENTSSNKLKIYITAPSIENSSIIMKLADENYTVPTEGFPIKKASLAIVLTLLFAGILISSKSKTASDEKLLIKKDIKEREIEMYRKYRRNLEEDLSLNSRKELHMKSMLKKIDRKIDERLSTLK